MSRLYTIGHSTRSLENFIELLRHHGIKQLLDVRTIPRSRRNPQYNKETLSKALRNRGIGYRHMKGLGGLRHAKRDSINIAWENASFRGYADYMQTEPFEANLQNLIKLARKKKTAIMCAEAVPWRCHRSLVADAATIKKIEVFHIMSTKKLQKHSLKRSFMPMPVLRGGKIQYPKP